MRRVLGLDLSLASTGLADVTDGAVQVWRKRTTGREDASLAARHTRLRGIVRDLSDWWADDRHTVPVDLVAVEGPSLGQARQGGQHDRAGLWWLVMHDLHSRGVPVAEIAPAARAKYATGKGNASKDAVVAAVTRRYQTVPVELIGNDTADALVLAAMAARALGHPIDDMPKLHLEAMRNVRWPHDERDPAS